MKIVLDTNVVLAALLSKRGASHRLLVWLFEAAQKHSVVSNTLLMEYGAVLTRSEHMENYPQFSRDEIERFLDDIASISYHQKIHFLWRPFLRDASDDMVLEVAANAHAEAIITFNPRDFQGVTEHFGIEILSPGMFLNQQGVTP